MARQNRDKLEDDHLIKQFRAFFDEVSKAQLRAIEMRETDPDLAAQQVSKHLENLIELQTLESKREGNRFELESIADARYLKAALADEIRETVWPVIAAGELRPVMDQCFALTEAAAAHVRMEQGAHIGKIVLKVA